MSEACIPSRRGGKSTARIARLLFFAMCLSLLGAITAEEAKAAKVVRTLRNDATGGDCTLVGNWDAATMTCTLSGNTTDLFNIVDDNITLDGNGFTITGTNTGLDRFEKGAGIAVNVVGRNGVTVRNINITRFDYAVDLVDTNNTAVTNVVATNSAWAGISLTRASNNTLTDNVISNNSIDTGICVGFSSSNNLIARNQVSTTERGIFVHTTCQYNDIRDNTLVNHVDALTFMENDSFNAATGNNISGSDVAVYSRGASNSVTFTGNTIENNGAGVKLEDVYNNQVTGNTLTGNATQAQVSGGGNNSFHLSKPDGGGNSWSDFDAPHEGCVDGDADGFCDSAYQFSGGTDSFPRADAASQSSGGECQEPKLRLAAPNPYWATYDDFIQRRLSSNMAIINYGTTPAYNVRVVVTLNTNGVMTLTQFPVVVGAVPAGETKSFAMQYLVPNGVQSFKSTLYTSATVACDTVYNYPDSAPIA